MFAHLTVTFVESGTKLISRGVPQGVGQPLVSKVALTISLEDVAEQIVLN